MPAITLPEETLDDILYFARANETPNLLTTLSTLAKQHAASPFSILAAAIDPDSGNSAVHYAAANGHADLLRQVFSLGGDAGTESAESREARRELVRVRNGAKNTALHYAALNGQLDAVRVIAAAALPIFIAPEPTKEEKEGEGEGQGTGAQGESKATATVPEASVKNREKTVEAALSSADRESQIAFLEARNSVDRDATAEAEAAGKDPVVGWLLGALDRLDPTAGEESSVGAAPQETSLGGDEVAEDVASMKVDT